MSVRRPGGPVRGPRLGALLLGAAMAPCAALAQSVALQDAALELARELGMRPLAERVLGSREAVES